MTEKTTPPKRASAAKPATAGKTVKKASTVAVVDSKTAKPAKAVAPKAAAAGKPVSAPQAKPAAAPKRKATEPQKPLLDAGQRAQYISVAAYYIAERRGFQGSYEHEDWTRAETEIDNLLRDDKLSA